MEANFFLCIYNSDSCFSVFICDVSRNAKLVFSCSHFAGCAFLCIFLFLAWMNFHSSANSRGKLTTTSLPASQQLQWLQRCCCMWLPCSCCNVAAVLLWCCYRRPMLLLCCFVLPLCRRCCCCVFSSQSNVRRGWRFALARSLCSRLIRAPSTALFRSASGFQTADIVCHTAAAGFFWIFVAAS